MDKAFRKFPVIACPTPRISTNPNLFSISNFPSTPITYDKKDLTKACRIFDTPFKDLGCNLIQSVTKIFLRYISLRIELQRPVPNKPLHKLLATRDLPKRKMFLRPHPSNNFGLAMASHLAK
jgi:hypothetical protein